LNRYYQSLSPYQNMAAEGRMAAGQLSGAGQSNANAVSGLYGLQGQAVGGSIKDAGMAEAQGIMGAGLANSNYLNQMGGALLQAGDIRATGYVNALNQSNQNKNNLYELAGTVAPYAYNAAKDWNNQPSQQPAPTWVNPDTGQNFNNDPYKKSWNTGYAT